MYRIEHISARNFLSMKKSLKITITCPTTIDVDCYYPALDLDMQDNPCIKASLCTFDTNGRQSGRSNRGYGCG